MLKSPFEMSNQGETIDKNFFDRLKRFEQYYSNHAGEDESFTPNFHAIKAINEVLQKEQLSMRDIEKAIAIYNDANGKNHHTGSGWSDLRLHLRHLAFVYGTAYITDRNLDLIVKEA